MQMLMNKWVNKMLNICKKKQMTDELVNINKSQNYAKWQKPNTK